MSERNSGFPYLALAPMMFSTGVLIGSALGKHDADTENKIKDVQAYNSQIGQELDQSFDSVEDLVLTIDGKTFAFVGDQEECTGKYKVEDEVAHIAGEVACSVELQTTQATVGN